MQCGNGGCLIELAQQLAVIMVGKQIINNAKEMLIPILKAWWHKKKVKYLSFINSLCYLILCSPTLLILVLVKWRRITSLLVMRDFSRSILR